MIRQHVPKRDALKDVALVLYCCSIPRSTNIAYVMGFLQQMSSFAQASNTFVLLKDMHPLLNPSLLWIASAALINSTNLDAAIETFLVFNS